MRLPLTIDQFLDVFRQYNDAVWPAQWILVTLALVAVVLAMRNRPGGDRWVSGILALLWFWMAAVYHLAFFAKVNRVAVTFAAAFAIQGIMFVWVAFRARPPSYRPRSTGATVIGALLIAYALLLYPALGYLLGHRYPSAPTFGVPCPTTIFTLGMIVWSSGSIPGRLLVVPLAWAIVGVSAAVNLGMTEDFGLLAAGMVSVAWILLARRGTSPARLARVATAGRS
jgi:Family of unknown function (DUF6064)